MAHFSEGTFLTRAIFHVVNFEVGTYSSLCQLFFALSRCTGSLSPVCALKIWLEGDRRPAKAVTSGLVGGQL